MTFAIAAQTNVPIYCELKVVVWLASDMAKNKESEKGYCPKKIPPPQKKEKILGLEKYQGPEILREKIGS